MIDLHIHTDQSDGTNTVQEILERANEKKLSTISITDHDTVQAYSILKTLPVKELYSGRIIPGIEMKTSYQRVPIEILGYGIHPDKIELEKVDIRKSQEEELDILKKVGKEIGLIFDNNIHTSEEGKEMFASWTFELELRKYSQNFEKLKEYKIDLNKGFYRAAQSNPDTIFYIDTTKRYPKLEKVIQTIHQAGGLAFLAHAYEYPWKNTIQTMQELIREYPIDGIECYHSSFNKLQRDTLLQFAKEKHLYCSGGTDFHGENKPGIELGIGRKNMEVSEKLVENWIEKIEEF